MCFKYSHGGGGVVRPKVKDGRSIQLYISKELLEQIERYKGSLSTSGFIEEAVKFVIEGNRRSIKLASEMNELLKELKELREEKERLAKENERLKKKIEKLEEEIEKWRAKWKGQTTLKKYEKKQKELTALADRILDHIEEGKTWREVARDAGFVLPADQVDIFNALFRKNGYGFISDIIGGWRLVPGRRKEDGIFGYVFKAIKSSGRAQALGKKTFVEVST